MNEGGNRYFSLWERGQIEARDNAKVIGTAFKGTEKVRIWRSRLRLSRSQTQGRAVRRGEVSVKTDYPVKLFSLPQN